MSDKITTEEFEQLFHKYYSRLYYYAYDFVEDIDVSKDIVSDVFVAIWNKKEQININTVGSYMYISVRNQCINYLQQKKKLNDYMHLYSSGTEDESEEDFENLERRIDEMNAEIEKMSPRTRYILEECYFHHKKYKEVAEILGISIDGVKKHIIKAFSIMRNHFNVKINK